MSLLEVFLLVSLSTLCIAVLNNPSSKIIGLDIVITVVAITLFVIMGILGYHAIKKHLSTCVLHMIKICITQSGSDEERPLLVPDALPRNSFNSAGDLHNSLRVGFREPLSEDH